MYFVALATDYDGTLAHNGVVDDRTLAALTQIKETGRRLILVTGRELPHLKEVFPQLNLFDCVVAENGALLYFPASELERPISPEPPAAFVEKLRQKQVEPLSVGKSIVATWEPNENKVLEAIRELGLELHIVFNKGAVMVLPANVNKASGLAAALDEMDISPLNVVGFGDAENDHAFLRSCGCAVAVANALPMVKDDADIVTAGARGDGVREIIERFLAGGEGDLIKAVKRHSILVGKNEDGQDVALYPSRGSVLISGRSGAGKSTLATALLERLMLQGFQLCVFDPEGDYEDLEDAVILGDAKGAPRAHEIFDVLKSPASHVVINMLGIDVNDRPAFFAEILADLAGMRAATGRPHWILIDEAHHMLPKPRDSVATTLPKKLPTAIFVTVHPDTMSPDALDQVDVVFGIGEAAPEIIEETCRAIGEQCPVTPQKLPGPDQALLWNRRSNEPPRCINVERPRQAHHRHTRKYAQGTLGEDKSFYFRGPENALNLRAQNLMIFVQIAEGVDEKTWLHHLRAGDYSEWFRAAIKDEDLAGEIAQIEADHDLNATGSRSAITDLIKKKYTAPASEND